MSKKTRLKIGEFSQLMQVTVKTLRHYEQKGPAGPRALCMQHIGPYERFYESFTEAFRYIEEQGYKVAGQHRTCYIDGAWNQEDPEKWLSVIQIPIE